MPLLSIAAGHEFKLSRIRQPLPLRALHRAISDVNLTGRNSFILTDLIISRFRSHLSYIVFAEIFRIETFGTPLDLAASPAPAGTSVLSP
jgi:hypothetical protein